MNPKLADFESSYERYMEAYEELVALSKAEKRAKANQALDDLRAALGLDVLGASLDNNFEHVRIPVAAIQLITARLQALAAGDPLAEGRL